MHVSITTRLVTLILVISFVVILIGCGSSKEDSIGVTPDVEMEQPMPEPEPEVDPLAELRAARDKLISEVQQIESILADARDHLADGYDLLDLLASGRVEVNEASRQSAAAAVRQQEDRVRTLENQLSNARVQLHDLRLQLGELEALPSHTAFDLPRGHAIQAGEYMIQPGQHAVIGNIAILCPDGGNGCAITVAASGLATYDSVGGTPSLLASIAGDTEMTDQAYFPIRGTYFTTHALTRNAVGAENSTQIPNALRIGAPVPIPPHRSLAPVDEQGGISTQYGTQQDGISAAALIAYLAHEARVESMIKRFGDTPPIVRVVAGAPERMVRDAAEIVKAINSALPSNWQLRFSDDPAPGISEALEGQILIAFQDSSDTSLLPEGQEGIAFTRTDFMATGDPERPYVHPIIAGRALVRRSLWDRIPVLGRLFLTHEILHTLGREHPHIQTDFFNQTVMGNPLVAPGQSSGHSLTPLDRDAMRAVYGVLEVSQPTSELTETLGSWSDTSSHHLGRFDVYDEQVVFGVASRNGFIDPYVEGPKPWLPLSNSPAVSGQATWRGRLAGFTSATEVVSGDAQLGIELSTLQGNLGFSDLQYWMADTAPGTAGSGLQWGDGTLDYDIQVRHNYFTQTGGDEGVVTGAFFGPLHEGMGGVLERDDLTAAFGGKR